MSGVEGFSILHFLEDSMLLGKSLTGGRAGGCFLLCMTRDVTTDAF